MVADDVTLEQQCILKINLTGQVSNTGSLARRGYKETHKIKHSLLSLEDLGRGRCVFRERSLYTTFGANNSSTVVQRALMIGWVREGRWGRGTRRNESGGELRSDRTVLTW